MKPLATLAVALCAAALAAAPAQAAPRVVALTPFAASTITRLGVRPVAIGQTLGGSDQYLASLRGVPVAHALASARPEPRAARDLQPADRALEQDVAARHARDAPHGHEGLRERPGERRGGRERDARDRRGARPHARRRRAGAPDRGRRRGGQARHQAPPARAGHPRRRAHAVRDARQLLGRRRRPPGRRHPAHAGADLAERDRAGSPTRSWSSATRTSSSPCRTATRATSAPRRLLPQQPELAQHAGGRNRRVYVATGNSLLQPYPGVAATIRDVRRKFLKN